MIPGTKRDRQGIAAILYSAALVHCLCWCVPVVCHAAPVGNPGGPVLLDGNYPTKFSLEVETLFDKKLKSGSGGKAKLTGTFLTGKVSFYLGKRLDIYGLIGTYDGKLKHFIDETYIITSKMDVAWGLGAAYVLYEREYMNGVLRVGVDGKYRQFRPDIDSVQQYREDVRATNTELSFKEWQAALGLSYQYKNYVPYCGLKYSNMKSHIAFNYDGIMRSDKGVHADDTIGLFYGIDVLLTDSLSLNVEGRAIDETAANIGFNARF